MFFKHALERVTLVYWGMNDEWNVKMYSLIKKRVIGKS